MGRPKSTWKRELQNELKKEINKLSVKPQQLLLPKKMERPCVWPTLYLEINGNDEDIRKLEPVQCRRLTASFIAVLYLVANLKFFDNKASLNLESAATL